MPTLSTIIWQLSRSINRQDETGKFSSRALILWREAEKIIWC